jgi:sRNA-binding regulator protein Hfq
MSDRVLGQHVKCFLRNTMVLEGIAEEWSDTRVVLKSLDGKSLMIVHRPVEDIVLTKVVLEEPAEISKEAKVVEETEHKQRVKEKLNEVLLPTGDPDLDKSNIKQLRQLVVEQEKKIITEKRREHFGSAYAPGKMGKYSIPKSAYMPSKPCKNNAD